MGVDKAQGFHIGRPAPLAQWLVEDPRRNERAKKLITRAARPSRRFDAVDVRALVQRVSRAAVDVEGERVARSAPGCWCCSASPTTTP